jgi:RimJ/RimL family protein N-acetyltransferase|tara:strand:+ start:60 stop:512 length:453 start_codon:yes stop_codon:yes gene_type:complete
MNKLPIKDILAAIDMGAINVWDELSDEEKKQVSFYLLNRYVSSVKGDREKQELAVFKTNEYYNKHFFTLQKHKKLLWQLLCISGNTKSIAYHEWIGYKKKGSNDKNKVVKFLMQMYPNKKQDEVELLAQISTKKEIKEWAKEHGIEDLKL